LVLYTSNFAASRKTRRRRMPIDEAADKTSRPKVPVMGSCGRELEVVFLGKVLRPPCPL
jgi:hypothetical protein